MKRYKNWAPTQFDHNWALDGREDWLVVPVMQTRDSGCFAQSNFAAALAMLGGESETVEVHRFGHWGPGWVEIIIVAPGGEAQKAAEGIEERLADYPMLDEDDYYKRVDEEAGRIWADCYDAKERIAYIRKHKSQFEFSDFADMLGCVRGKHFSGYASELID